MTRKRAALRRRMLSIKIRDLYEADEELCTRYIIENGLLRFALSLVHREKGESRR